MLPSGWFLMAGRGDRIRADSLELKRARLSVRTQRPHRI